MLFLPKHVGSSEVKNLLFFTQNPNESKKLFTLHYHSYYEVHCKRDHPQLVPGLIIICGTSGPFKDTYSQIFEYKENEDKTYKN